ncbi:hypothetical protein F0Q45_25855 [Mycobacterium simiae]|uniref:Uncharacterized protein n=1 Tax=Mycobacterium simiae TaxID=1784 RepID=A0A5B1B6V3_MYCSI|nr:hypothetical protein [Mycobacterium simiae]KAA1243113.1 hypothetical protein F0Q45_25855 [Mycobacterium simiae]
MTDPFYSHIAAVDVVAAHGIAPPREWSALRARFEAFLSTQHPCTARLAAEIVRPSGADVDVLRAAALAEHYPEHEHNVTAVVRSAVHSELLRLVAPTAARAYRAVAKEFDAVAAKFIAAAKVADPDLGSEEIVYCPESQRQAWLSAAVLAVELDGLTPVLYAAATLTGAPAEVASPLTDADTWRLPLVTNPGALHRRRVWEAWQATGRCGRWAALHKLSAEIRAHAKPEALQPYAQPEPFIVKYEPGPKGGHQKVVYDPHDSDQPGVLHRVGRRLVRHDSQREEWSA